MTEINDSLTKTGENTNVTCDGSTHKLPPENHDGSGPVTDSGSESKTGAGTVQGAENRTQKRTFLPAANSLRFWLMPFACIACFGFQLPYGWMLATFSNVAPLCFFILCGFFNLPGFVSLAEWDGDKTAAAYQAEKRRTLRPVKRAIKMLFIMFLICFAVNVLYDLFNGNDLREFFEVLASRRVLFNFLVLCAWPFQMGDSIWFIQSLLYAYLILLLLSRTLLLTSRVFRYLLFFVCAAAAIYSGELAGLVKVHIFGYPYLPPNAITRALPYMLLGLKMKELREKLNQADERYRNRWKAICLVMIPFGLFLTWAEFTMLSRAQLLAITDHAVGLGITAFGVCGSVLLFAEEISRREMAYRQAYTVSNGRSFARQIYLINQPVAFMLLVPTGVVAPAFAAMVYMLGGVIVYLVCLGILVIADLA